MGRRFHTPRLPRFRTPLGLDDPELGSRPEALREHRELEVLRAAGARQSRRLDRRTRKLDQLDERGT